MAYRHKPAKVQGEDTRDFDTTSLKLKGAGNFVHRDYAAHFFRWGFAANWIRGGERVLDIGCGAEQPLVRILCHKPGGQPSHLLGVDYDNVKKRWSPAWFALRAPFDFTTEWKKLAGQGLFDVITCFEVIEHMQVASGRKLLKGAFELLEPMGTMLLSTPIYDGKKMAQNHIHEYYVPELEVEIRKAGFSIQRRFGTFQTALQAKRLSPTHQVVWRELSAYYSNDVMACFLAPLYPDLARNNLWVLRKIPPVIKATRSG
jgi:SAM-dependent methyltransferase